MLYDNRTQHPCIILLNVFNSIRKSYKMFGKPHILYIFLNSFDRFKIHNHSSKSLYLYFFQMRFKEISVVR